MSMTHSFWRALIAVLVIAGLQTGILGYVLVSRAAILRHGEEVLLKTAPVDPRDLLRGDYVTLSYAISSIPAAAVVGDRPAASGRESLFVRLDKRDGEFWGVREASFTALPPAAGTVVVRTLPFPYYHSPEAPYDMQVEYGIERYYVPEGEGKVLEAARGSEALSVAVRVSKEGQAQIRALFLDGIPAYDEPLY